MENPEPSHFHVYLRCNTAINPEHTCTYPGTFKVDHQKSEITISKSGSQDSPTEPQTFSFRYIFNANNTQQEVYSKTTAPLVEAALSGYNAAILAYGPTKSGKTYTMEGLTSPEEFKGIIPRSAEHLFEEIEMMPDQLVVIQASYVSIYLEKIFDLLSDNTALSKPTIQETAAGVVLEDVTLVPIKSLHDFYEMFKKARKNSSQIQSPYKYDVLILTIETCSFDEEGLGEPIVSRLYFADMANSQKSKPNNLWKEELGPGEKPHNRNGSRIPPLNMVILSLTDGLRAHIPYRDSKFTHLLRDAFGGNCITSLIGHLNPSLDYEESLATLKFLSKASNVRNAPTIGESVEKSLLKPLQVEIETLRSQFEATFHKVESFITNMGILGNFRSFIEDQRRIPVPSHETQECIRVPELRLPIRETQKPTKLRALKVCFEKEIHLILKSPPTFKEFLDTVRNLYKCLPSNFCLQYEDSEGDRITVSSDIDYKNMIDNEALNSSKALKVYISSNKDRSLLDDLAPPTFRRDGASFFDVEDDSSFLINDEPVKSNRSKKLVLADISGEKKLSLEEEIRKLELERERLNKEIMEKKEFLKNNENLKGAILDIVNQSLEQIVPIIKSKSDKVPHIPKVRFNDSASQFWSNDSEKSTSKEASLSPHARDSSFYSKIHKRTESSREPSRNSKSIFGLSKISSARQDSKANTASSIFSHRPTFSKDLNKSQNEEDFSSDDINENEYAFHFVKEVSTSPPQILTTTNKVYKIIQLRNIGDCPWPNDCFLEPSSKSKGYIARLSQSPEPGEEIRATICIINSGRPGKQKSQWRLAYKTASGHKKYIGNPFEIVIDVKMIKSHSACDAIPLLPTDSIQKAKKLKEAFPHAKFEDLLGFISKQDDSLSHDDLVQCYLDTLQS